jgi:nicotinate-nucleotide adenylyltransferase
VKQSFAVFGGSFDPPHVAHALAACYALNTHPIERVLVVPTYEHAFGKRLAPFEDRLRMCELAFAGLRGVDVLDLERHLPAPSLTLRSLEALARLYPEVQLRLLIGADILAQTYAWHDFERVSALAPPLVVQRQGHPQLDPQQPALPAVSSTEIRRRLRCDEPTEGLLNPAVALYVRSHGLYANDVTPSPPPVPPAA